MKNVFKRIVAMLLALAVAGCAVWYLFVYDRDFARDLLVTQARYLDSNGRHDLAAWFYDQAYLYADNDASVALELAEQYHDIGNYTKAEYTLSNAISREPTVELYTALCQIFVEQDKLIDAVRLLDQIADPAMKQAIEAMRPAAPQSNQTPGFYNYYISVSLTGNTGILLYSTDQEYPSVNEDPYTGPITLPQGETDIYAICIGENGLVSPMVIFGYTIGGVVEEVHFTDTAIDAQVRTQLGLAPEAPIYSSDLWTITEFTVPAEASGYSDLSKLTHLTSLTIHNAKSSDLSFLGSMNDLQELTVTGCALDRQAMHHISASVNLQKLTLAHCSLSDISPLSALPGLTYLDLSYNSIRDLTPLSAMHTLQSLYLSNNAVTDLTALAKLSSLTTLNVSYNSVSSLMPICESRSLERLNVSNNLLKDLGDLDLMPSLKTLDASANDLTDISVLGRCFKLEKLNISGNRIEKIDALKDLLDLRELDCSHNSVTALPDWTAENFLIILNASYNDIQDVTVLAQLQMLNRLDLDYNSRVSDVSALAKCPLLIEVNLFGTKVTDVSMLTAQSIIVHYNPTDVDVDSPE